MKVQGARVRGEKETEINQGWVTLLVSSWIIGFTWD